MKLSDSKMATVHSSERREERFALPFEIAVSGINGEGKAFHITVQTRNVSEWAARPAGTQRTGSILGTCKAPTN